MTNYLRFPDQETWLTSATAAGYRVNQPILTDDVYEDNWTFSYYTNDWAIDDVGIIYNNDAVIDPDTGEIITPATQMEGWHVNIVGTLPDGWEQYVVNPSNPYRVFA